MKFTTESAFFLKPHNLLLIGALVVTTSCKEAKQVTENAATEVTSPTVTKVEWKAVDLSALNDQEGEVVAFRAGEVRYLAQKAKDSSLLLTASNVFFDKGAVRALGKHVSRPHEKSLISSEFKF